MPKKPLEKLPEAELDVMLALWTHTQPVRTARLLEDLADKAWSLSTLKVLLGRLADKSFVEVTREAASRCTAHGCGRKTTAAWRQTACCGATTKTPWRVWSPRWCRTKRLPAANWQS